MKKELLEEIEKLASLDKHQEVIDKIKGKDFDILLTVGAGNIDTLYDGLLEWFEQR